MHNFEFMEFSWTVKCNKNIDVILQNKYWSAMKISIDSIDFFAFLYRKDMELLQKPTLERSPGENIQGWGNVL